MKITLLLYTDDHTLNHRWSLEWCVNMLESKQCVNHSF